MLGKNIEVKIYIYIFCFCILYSTVLNKLIILANGSPYTQNLFSSTECSCKLYVLFLKRPAQSLKQITQIIALFFRISY